MAHFTITLKVETLAEDAALFDAATDNLPSFLADMGSDLDYTVHVDDDSGEHVTVEEYDPEPPSSPLKNLLDVAEEMWK